MFQNSCFMPHFSGKWEIQTLQAHSPFCNQAFLWAFHAQADFRARFKLHLPNPSLHPTHNRDHAVVNENATRTAYGESYWNLNWPIRIQRVEKKNCAVRRHVNCSQLSARKLFLRQHFCQQTLAPKRGCRRAAIRTSRLLFVLFLTMNSVWYFQV